MPSSILKLLCTVSLFSGYCESETSEGFEQLDRTTISEKLTPFVRENQLPEQLTFNLSSGAPVQGELSYTLDEELQASMDAVYKRYRPDFACFVGIDAETGAILTMNTFTRAEENLGHLALRADYPAASVFKMISAAATIEDGILEPETVIPYNGKSTSLYKRQVLKHRENKWTRTPTLEESFARSINPVFGQIGVFKLGKERLLSYAERFGFGQPLQTDFSVPSSRVLLDFDDKWELAEAASGYTKDIKLSPVHAAQLAAIVVNDGKLVTPYLVDSVVSPVGEALYAPNSGGNRYVLTPESASDMQRLFKATTRIGSARKSFSGMRKYRIYKGVEVGGKTGTLTGDSPKGRHD